MGGIVRSGVLFFNSRAGARGRATLGVNEINKYYQKISESVGRCRPLRISLFNTVPWIIDWLEYYTARELMMWRARANKKQRSCFHRARGVAWRYAVAVAD